MPGHGNGMGVGTAVRPRRPVQLASLPIINRTVAERERLLNLRAEVLADRLQLTIGSTYQDDAMVALVRPVVLGEINGRVRALERDLESMGVDLG